METRLPCPAQGPGGRWGRLHDLLPHQQGVQNKVKDLRAQHPALLLPPKSLFHPSERVGHRPDPSKRGICPEADRTWVRPFPPTCLQPQACTQNHAWKTCKGFTVKSMKTCEHPTSHSTASAGLYSLPVLPGEVTQLRSFPYPSRQCLLSPSSGSGPWSSGLQPPPLLSSRREGAVPRPPRRGSWLSRAARTALPSFPHQHRWEQLGTPTPGPFTPWAEQRSPLQQAELPLCLASHAELRGGASPGATRRLCASPGCGEGAQQGRAVQNKFSGKD